MTAKKSPFGTKRLVTRIYSNRPIASCGPAEQSTSVLEILKGIRVCMRNQVVLEPCVRCDKQECCATVVLSALTSGRKQFNEATDCLDLTCPACNRPFSTSIFKLEWLEVSEHEFAQGFFGATGGIFINPENHPFHELIHASTRSATPEKSYRQTRHCD